MAARGRKPRTARPANTSPTRQTGGSGMQVWFGRRGVRDAGVA